MAKKHETEMDALGREKAEQKDIDAQAEASRPEALAYDYFRISAVSDSGPNGECRKRPIVGATAHINSHVEWDAIRSKTWAELANYIMNEKTRRKLETAKFAEEKATAKRKALEAQAGA